VAEVEVVEAEAEEEDLDDIDDGEGKAKREEEEKLKAVEAEEAAAAAAASAAREEETIALCVAQRADGSICGAVGWYELGTLPSSLAEAVAYSGQLPPPRRCARLDDGSWHSSTCLHMSLQGYGAGSKPVTPVGYNLRGSALYHFAAGMRGFHVAAAQNLARLSQGGASDGEKDHVAVLMAACRENYAGVARQAADGKWLPPEFTRCESAVEGLRKTLLRRPWAVRCTQCGVRHEYIEFSTCRFWQAWVV
jgi:hypothetical protein